jgi:hypothetical protein
MRSREKVRADLFKARHAAVAKSKPRLPDGMYVTDALFHEAIGWALLKEKRFLLGTQFTFHGLPVLPNSRRLKGNK